MNNNTLNLERLTLFIKRQVTMNIQPVLIGIGGIFGILLIISLLVAKFNAEDFENLFNFFMVIFFVGGFIFTSRVFSELNSSRKSYAFLMLPISNLEKIIGSWLLSSPIYIVGFTAFTFLILFITKGVFGIETFLMDMFSKPFLIVVAVYMVTQTIFFLGACTFKSYNLLKTLLAVFVLIMSISFLTGGIGWILFSQEFSGDNNVDLSEGGMGETMFKEVIPALFWYVLGPFLLIVSYFKLKEREV